MDDPWPDIEMKMNDDISEYFACRKCHILNKYRRQCYNCGSKDLSETWSVLVIVAKPRYSGTGVKMPGLYAEKVP